MSIIDYDELLTLVDKCLHELENYIAVYEKKGITSFSKDGLEILQRSKDIALHHKEIDVNLLKSIRHYSIVAVKEYYDTDLEKSILNLGRFFMKYIPNFNNY